MPSKCRVNCHLHDKFEILHKRLERLDYIEMFLYRLRASLPLQEAERYRALTSKISQVGRTERRIVNKINRITWILSANGPGCFRCVATGVEYE